MAVAKALRAVGALAGCAGLALAWGVRAEPPGAPRQPASAASTPAQAVGPPRAVIGKHFAVAPVTTDLQRRLIRRSRPSSAAIVLVDGQGLFVDSKSLDLDALDFKGIREALTAYQPAKSRSVHFQIHCPGPSAIPLHPNGHVLLLHGLEGYGRKLGFGGSDGEETYHNDRFVWADWVAPLREENAAGSETPVGDERVTGYRVQTPLSRLLLGSSAADGVIDLRMEVDLRAGAQVPEELDRSVHDALKKLGLEKGKKVMVRFNRHKSDADRDVSIDLARTLAIKWTEAHGLVLASFTV